jgi:hypothetical protein
MLRNVLELFSVKEKLLTSRKHKLGSTVDAFQVSIEKLHTLSPLQNSQRQNAAS